MTESLPAIADRTEILVLLSVAARTGNVSAMRLLLEEFARDTAAPSTSIVDQLAARRALSPGEDRLNRTRRKP